MIKNKIAQSVEAGISVIAFGYAINARPGPETKNNNFTPIRVIIF